MPDPTTGPTFRALGAAELVGAGGGRAFARRRGVALAAWLLELGRPAPRERAAELLWPGESEGVARARLRRLLHRLGEAAPGAVDASAATVAATAALAAGYDGARLRRAAETALGSNDAAALTAATALYGGPFLDGLDLDDCAELDAWAAGARLEYERLAARLLRRLAEAEAAAGRPEAAIAAADRLAALDPLRESTHRLLLRLCADAGDREGAARRHRAFVARLRDETGAPPAPETAALATLVAGGAAASPHDALPAVRYAPAPGGPVAYAVIGSGAQALVVAPGFVSHVEMAWEDPPLRAFLTALSRRRRVLIFDRRGQGLSERIGVRQSVDEVARDILAILDAEGLARASILGSSEGGPSAIRLAHARPERVDRLVLFGATARGVRDDDHPHALTAEQFDRWRRALVAAWGTPAAIETFAPSRAADPAFRAWWARVLRLSATPASIGATLTALKEADVRPLLPEVAAPALVLHREGDRAIRVGAGRALAAAMPAARFVPLPGDDHWFWCGDAARALDEIEAFLG